MIVRTEVVEHLLLFDVSWDAYERLLEAFGNRRLRHTYIDGTLEIMSPLKRHEWIKKAIARIVETIALHENIPIQCVGSTTLKRNSALKSIEPDESYYIRNVDQVKPTENFVIGSDPPPDLVIEVDITHADLNREIVYSELQIPEYWRYDEDLDAVKMVRLSAGRYEESLHSVAFPRLTSAQLTHWIHEGRLVNDDNHLVRSVVAWLKTSDDSKAS